MIRRTALNGERDDVLRVELRLVLCLLFEVPDLNGDVVAGFLQDLVGEQLFRFFLGELGNALKLLHHEFVLMREHFLLFGYLFDALVQIFLLCVEGLVLFVEFRLFALEEIFLLGESGFRALLFGALFLHLLFKIVSSL